MISGLTFSHHGLAVHDDIDALRFLGTLGYSLGDLIYEPAQDIRLRLCEHEHLPTVEIVAPGDSPGPLTAVLSRHNSLIYHTCYEVDDRDEVLALLEARELRILNVLPPTPAILFGNRKVSFHTVLGYGLIELLDRS